MRSAFSTIIVHSLLFIAAAVAAYIFVSSLYNNLYQIKGAMEIRENLLSSRLKTVFDIDSCFYDNSTTILSLYLTNRGAEPLDPNKLTLFLNGVLHSIESVSFVYVINDDNVWEKYETIKITTSVSPGTYNVKVVASNGAYDEKTIYITDTSCSIL